ncbi:anti-sigma factor [Dermatobacter hominis]|uniref:anti-sigma factor n=1 Tax=Dermatobacter hominis TaxID=2884263 RepID=UPI001D10F0A7|nr:anti-sigma factor [Dermatobacter hominis]UDY36055.1 anti-sigma factor [Dermatobacter hominis]
MARPDVGGGGPVGPGPDDGFGREADLVRSLGDEPVELVDAPDGLWDRIAAAVEAEDAPGRAGASEQTGPGAGADSDRVRFTVHDGEGAATTSRTAAAGADRGHRWRTVVLGAAAVVAVLAIGAGVVVATRDEGPTEVAAAELAPFDGAQVGAAGGRVELIEDGDQVRLRVDMHDLPAPAPGTFYELWLLDPETGEPVSIATMKDGSSDVTTDIDVPPGTDTARFDVVDVSVQEEAAGPEHSGDSVLRGTLSA